MTGAPEFAIVFWGRGEVRVVAGLSEGELMVRAEGRVLVEKSV